MPPPRIPLPEPRRELPCDRQLWLAIAAELALSPQQQRIVELLLLGYQDKQICKPTLAGGGAKRQDAHLKVTNKEEGRRLDERSDGL